MAATLQELAEKHGTDKTGDHSYIKHYARHFEQMRHDSLFLLEIGVGGYEKETGGESLRMWEEYFPNATIFGLDVYEKNITSERIKVFRGNQADPVSLSRVLAATGGRKFKVIIDDGSHRSEHVIATFIMLFRYLENGGFYVIEDTQCSYWNDYGGNSTDLNSGRTTVSYFKNLVDDVNWREIHKPHCYPDQTALSIVSIYFCHNMIWIEKGDNQEQSNIVKNNIVPAHLVGSS